MESIKLSPLRSVLRKNISDVKESTKRYYKRKANESIDSLLDLIAPKQGQDLKEEVIPTLSCAQMQNIRKRMLFQLLQNFMWILWTIL